MPVSLAPVIRPSRAMPAWKPSGSLGSYSKSGPAMLSARIEASSPTSLGTTDAPPGLSPDASEEEAAQNELGAQARDPRERADLPAQSMAEVFQDSHQAGSSSASPDPV